MISMDCNHPDIEDFIEIKSDLNKVTKANISIKITDEFMKAVKENKDFKLSFTRPETNETIEKTVNAKNLFNKICKMNWDYAEPGMLFWDRIENYNLLSEDDNFHYAGTNPCAEEPLPAGGSCLLGSINLSAFVKENKKFDFNDFSLTVSLAVGALNDVLDEGLPLHPLAEQRTSVRDWRQIGLGIFGLADMLIKMGIRYGSKESIELCDKIGFTMANEAIATSAYLAKNCEKTYPKYSKNILKSKFFIENTNNAVKGNVREYGLFNSQLLTIAPTGSLSSMIGVSGGIEPIFANYYTRKTESLHGHDEYYKVYTPIVKKYMDEHNMKDDSNLPDYFITAQDLNYEERIDMQSIWQKHIDASISSTVNLPKETTVEIVENLYMKAWEKGLKGITIFRDNCKRSGILTTSDKKEENKENKISNNENTEEVKNNIKYNSIIPVSRKTIGTTSGCTFCKKSSCGTLYITINKDSNGNIVESFVNASKGGICQSNINGLNRMISVALRSGTKPEEIIDQLKGITCPACVKTIGKGKRLDGISCPDIIGKTIEEFCRMQKNNGSSVISQKEINKSIKNTKEILESSKKIEEKKNNNIENPISIPTSCNNNDMDERKNTDRCPDCGEPIIHDCGCVICTNCGWSKCD